MTRIIGANTSLFNKQRNNLPLGKFNGAYYYALEIEKIIIPLVKTDRPWDLLGKYSTGSFDNAIVFLHNNVNHEAIYGSWIGKGFKNQIFVANQKITYDYVKSKNLPCIFLPLSIDISDVQKYKTEKTKEACYVGNQWKWRSEDIKKYVPKNVDFAPQDLEREELLKFMAPYKKCYAISRCALEAKALGCEVLKCHSYLDPDDFPLIDSREAAKMLQTELDKYDK